MPALIIIMTFISTLVMGVVMCLLTRSVAIAVVGGAFIGLSIRDVYFAESLDRPIFYQNLILYLMLLGMSLMVAGIGTLVFKMGLRYPAEDQHFARKWACVLVAICCSIPTGIPISHGSYLHVGVAPIATISIPALMVLWGAFAFAVIGVVIKNRIIVLVATLAAVAVSVCVLSFGDERRGGINLTIIPAVIAVILSIIDLSGHDAVTIRGDTLRHQR